MKSSKEKILQKISNALYNKTDKPFSEIIENQELYAPTKTNLVEDFSENFVKISGKLKRAKNIEEAQAQFKELVNEKAFKKIYCKDDAIVDTIGRNFFNTVAFDNLANCDASVTGCAELIARTGSIVLKSNDKSGRTVSVYAPIHICIAYTNQIVFDLSNAFQNYTNKNVPSFITLATGPSRTADIEKTLVTGVHGPKEVYLILIDHK